MSICRDDSTSAIDSVTVIGAGVMGKSVTRAISSVGIECTLVTRRGKEGFGDFVKYFQREHRKGRIKLTRSRICSLVGWTKKWGEAVKDVDFVIEAVVENRSVKEKLFKELDRSCSQKVILASNTSSLSITDISSVTENRWDVPERCDATKHT